MQHEPTTTRPKTSSESNALSKQSASKGLPPPASASADTFSIYILHCSDGSLYVGHTTNLPARIAAHKSGRGAPSTANYQAVDLIYSEKIIGKQKAVARELQIKRWTRAKKLALAMGDRMALKSLAKRQTK